MMCGVIIKFERLTHQQGFERYRYTGVLVYRYIYTGVPVYCYTSAPRVYTVIPFFRKASVQSIDCIMYTIVLYRWNRQPSVLTEISNFQQISLTIQLYQNQEWGYLIKNTWIHLLRFFLSSQVGGGAFHMRKLSQNFAIQILNRRNVEMVDIQRSKDQISCNRNRIFAKLKSKFHDMKIQVSRNENQYFMK